MTSVHTIIIINSAPSPLAFLGYTHLIVSPVFKHITFASYIGCIGKFLNMYTIITSC